MVAPIVNYRLLITGHCPMSRSHFIFRMFQWMHGSIAHKKSHQNPLNRVFHTIGIPMIAVSIPLFLIASLVRGFWKILSRVARQSPAT